MVSRKKLACVLALAAPLALVTALVAACGGGIEGQTIDDTSYTPRPRGPHPGPQEPYDAGTSTVSTDAAATPCACTDELVQVPGTCSFTIGPSLISCVAEHGVDAGSEETLNGTLSCAPTSEAGVSEAGTVLSWTPSVTPNQLTLCGCTPGQTYSLCAQYF